MTSAVTDHGPACCGGEGLGPMASARSFGRNATGVVKVGRCRPEYKARKLAEVLQIVEQYFRSAGNILVGHDSGRERKTASRYPSSPSVRPEADVLSELTSWESTPSSGP